ncbi:unnamed protein product [Auanema sp. JU1783]|nr:unnamed protein product [Auanema sp. JU1783]
MSVVGPADSKKLVEALLGDLRLISTESKKKYNQVKEAAESGVVKVRNISTASSDSTLLTNLRAASSELLHPLALACGTRQSRLVQVGLQGIQRLVQHRILEPSCANVVVNELWCLVESECEELRVLQTVPPLVSADLLVTGNNLAKCIVMCFRMHFAKDTVVINAASAAVRQLVGGVFERVIQEDGVFSGDLTVVPPSGGRPSSRSAPPTLRPCAADAYMLFKDLCLLINAEPPIWLVGIKEITRTLGLELLESLLKSYPGVFLKHAELGQLVKQEVCQLIIKLFSANFKTAHLTSQNASSKLQHNNAGSPPERPFFPIAMRLIRIVVVLISFYHQLLQTESEIFISHLLKFVDADKRGWQRPLALEALHRIVASSDILRWISENFDNQPSSAKILKQIAECLSSVIQQGFVSTQYSSDGELTDSELSQQSGSPGFYLRGVWIPYIEHLTTKKTILFDSLERHEPSNIPEGYVVSRCCSMLADMTQNSYIAIDYIVQQEESGETSEGVLSVALSLYESIFTGLLCGFTILLNASVEETVTDLLLCGVSTLVAIGCKLRVENCTRQSLHTLCSASLPTSQYLTKYAGIQPMEQLPDQGVLSEAEPSHSFHQVVATGWPCPSPAVSSELWTQQVALSSRNLQAARVLMGVVTGHSQMLQDFWLLSLTACEHLSWLLNIKPSTGGLFVREKVDADSNSGSVIVTVTNAAVAEVPVLASFLDKINFTSSVLNEENLGKMVDALIRLSDEQVTVASSGKECSFYPLASLLRVCLSNLERVETLWAKVTDHFLSISCHSSPTLREWSSTILTTLIRQAVKGKSGCSSDEHQAMCLSTLLSLSKTTFPEARRKQLECLMAILQTEGSQLHSSSWGTLITIVSSVVEKGSECDENIVRQGYMCARLVSTDFLQSLPFECIGSLVEAISRYGQMSDPNISLSALTLLWTISDYVYRRTDSIGPDGAEKVWLVLYTCLSELCVDPRHSVRKSACQTFLQTVAAHGHALRPATWTHMIWQIIMPLLDRVRSNTRSASNEKSSSSLIMHHSRDTEQKQWTETCINTLSNACKMFNIQRKVLLDLDDFPSAWEAMLSYIEWAACYDNAELSLFSLRSFQEILLGRVSAQTLDRNTRDRSASNPENACNEQMPQLPQGQWLESWNTWHSIARGLAKLGAAATNSQGGLVKGAYVPGPSHLTTLLHIFPALFERVAKVLPIEELLYEQLPSVIESLVSAPVPSEQTPFIMPSTSSQLTPTQEAVLDAIRTTYNECLSPTSTLRKAIADQIRLLLKFASLAVRNNPRTAPPGKNYKDWALQCVIPFAETSLKMATEFFTTTSSFPEVIDSLVAVDLVQFLGEPLYLKYHCISTTTWKLAASSLMSVLKSAIPYARQNPEKFAPFWPAICETLEKFLFTPHTCTRLAADERKRDELTECQSIDLIRTELLSHSSSIPASAVQRLIALLNRGSISQLDPNDVLDAHTQRAELARACFEALLSTSNDGDGSLGHVAVSSLLQRCTQVMGGFVRDRSGSGDLHLPRMRLAEMVSALQAIESLINRLVKNPSLTELYSQLVSLYPTVVDVIPCGHSDPLLESQLVITLKAYQTLLLLKVVPNFNS